jgi:hypothetical protein
LKWYKDIVPHADIHEKHFRKQTQNLGIWHLQIQVLRFKTKKKILV